MLSPDSADGSRFQQRARGEPASLATAGLLIGMALIATCGIAALSLQLTAETFERVRGDILIICGLLTTFIVIGAFVSIREDRRRRAVQDEVRNSESRMRTILETAVDGIVSIDDHGIVQRINEAAERMFGYSRHEVVGQNVKILMPPLDRDAHDAHLARYRAGGERKIIGIGREVMCRRKDGSEFPVDLAVGEYRIGEQQKFTGFLRDISERKRSEARIREQAALLDKAREAIFVRDLDDRIIFWNPAAERLYGWTADDVRGKTCRDLLFRGDGAQLEPARRAVLDEGEWAGELRLETKEGRTVIVESRWSLLRDEKGAPVEILSIEADVTEKKERERQALRAQRLESIGTLAGGIAHDLNNMLTPILMSAKLLKRERPAHERHGLADNILASAERGAELIRQLLSFTGGIETERRRIDLRAVMREVTSLLEHTLAKSISVKSTSPEELWPITGDETQVAQVLMNLCVNARDAMPSGGTLTVTAANCQLDQDSLPANSGLSPGSYVELTVSDTGGGIPPDVIDRIFDPFFTTKAIGKGTGLGLSTVLGIVRTHGGSIQVESHPGQGTTFTVFLPASCDGVALRAPVPVRHSPRAEGRRILIVDNEPFILTAASAALKEAGYDVTTASDGREALTTFQRHEQKFDVVLLDMMMPGIDGREVMRALWEIEPQLAIVASSGLKRADEVIEGHSGRPLFFLQKPYTDDQLFQAVWRAIHEGTAQ